MQYLDFRLLLADARTIQLNSCSSSDSYISFSVTLFSPQLASAYKKLDQYYHSCFKNIESNAQKLCNLYQMDHLKCYISGITHFPPTMQLVTFCPRPRRACLHHETATCISITLQAPLSILLTLLTNQVKSFNIGHCCGRESRSGDTHNFPYSILGFSPISSSLLISLIHSLFIE